MNWTFESEPFTETPDDMYGFIYKILYTDGTAYIGMKSFYSYITLPALKTGIPRPDSKQKQKRHPLTPDEMLDRTATQVRSNVKSKLVTYDIVRKLSKWQKYTGSSKLTAGKTIASKEILMMSESKRYLTYLEVSALFHFEVLESDTYLNENILGKFYRDNLV